MACKCNPGKRHQRYQGCFARPASLARSVIAGSRRASVGLLAVLAALLVIMPTSAQAQGDPEEPCPGGGYNPVPVEVEVTSVPIVVASTTDEYFVLYVRHDLDADTTVEGAVLVKRGEAGTTPLAENVEALPVERYRVEKYLVADPADVDGDCIDDITELGDPVGMNPVNPAPAIALSDGGVAIPDREAFETFALRHQFLKFILFGLDTDRPSIYFVNTGTYTGSPHETEIIVR